MSRWTRFISILLVTMMTAFFIGGCNTIEGAGEDIQRGGEAIEDAAD